MENILGLIAFIIFIFALVYLAIEKIRLTNKIKKVYADLIQSELDKNLIYDKMAELILEKENKAVEKTDGFLKFISDSRDWAYQYIELVQEELSKFRDAVGPEIQYFNTYGSVMESHHSETLRKISDAYDELQKLLPEENKEKNENQ